MFFKENIADESPFTLEERIVTSTWVHERNNTGDTMDTISGKFRERFNKNPPTRKTMSNWESKLFETGNIKNAPRSGRPVKRRESCAGVKESVINSPLKSTRRRSAELGIPRATIQTFVKKDLEVKEWRPTFVNELSDTDRENRKLACDELLRIFNTIPSRGKVMFTDECAIYRSSRARNVCFWAKENPHYYEELEYKTPHVMMWATLNARHVIGPYFFDGPVNHTSYLNMLQQWFIPKLNELGIREVWFQQDGVPARYALTVRDYLNDTFPDKWIGRGSVTSPAPMKCPARSSDLTT